MLFVWLMSIPLSLAQDIELQEGSGSFVIEGHARHLSDSIAVFYHKPKNFSQNSKILLVIPGAGRNADDYRDAWIEASEKYNVLIVSPSYPEKTYDYGAYHLAGVVQDLDLSKGVSFKKGTNQVHVDEQVVAFKVTDNKEDWLFSDFDRLFQLVKKVTKSKQKKYDMFGHSAGGQILHRLVLFHPSSKADRVLAGNSGTYTFPDFASASFPFGMKNVNVDQAKLKKTFQKQLVLFLGALDDDTETRGRMLRSKTADQQGTNRLDRGKSFYGYSKNLASSSGLEFNWKMEIVPDTGHDYRKMSEAAAAYLYGNQ